MEINAERSHNVEMLKSVLAEREILRKQLHDRDNDAGRGMEDERPEQEGRERVRLRDYERCEREFCGKQDIRMMDSDMIDSDANSHSLIMDLDIPDRLAERDSSSMGSQISKDSTDSNDSHFERDDRDDREHMGKDRVLYDTIRLETEQALTHDVCTNTHIINHIPNLES